MMPALQENLKHTLPSDSYDLIPDTSLDLRVGYEAQQINWLCFQRILQASLPEYLEDRPATLSSLLVRTGFCNVSLKLVCPAFNRSWLPAAFHLQQFPLRCFSSYGVNSMHQNQHNGTVRGQCIVHHFQITWLMALAVAQALKGIPAPFTGIKAWSD